MNELIFYKARAVFFLHLGVGARQATSRAPVFLLAAKLPEFPKGGAAMVIITVEMLTIFFPTHLTAPQHQYNHQHTSPGTVKVKNRPPEAFVELRRCDKQRFMLQLSVSICRSSLLM